jgi:hypothetical protein
MTLYINLAFTSGLPLRINEATNFTKSTKTNGKPQQVVQCPGGTSLSVWDGASKYQLKKQGRTCIRPRYGVRGKDGEAGAVARHGQSDL